MDIGTSITCSAGILGVVAVIFRIFSSKNDTAKMKDLQEQRMSDHCPDHSGVCITLDNMTAWLNKIEAKLDRVIEGK